MIRWILSILIFAPALASAEPMQTVPFVDVSRYLGTWYQISRNPLPFEDGCVCAQQTLSLRPDGLVGVYNSCNNQTVNGPLREIRGVARNDDPATNARFTVDFGLPQTGQYWVIGLDPHYRFAVVSDPSRRSLYILSKTPALDSRFYNEALRQASQQVSTAGLVMTVQNGCKYPWERR